MGYDTTFKGRLNFTGEIGPKQLVLLEEILGEDCRDHDEWDSGDLTHMDFCLTDDYEGIEWSGSEKSYDMVEKVNFIIQFMNEKGSGFWLEGEMEAQGEDPDDKWILFIKKGQLAISQEIIKIDVNDVGLTNEQVRVMISNWTKTAQGSEFLTGKESPIRACVQDLRVAWGKTRSNN